MVAIATNIDGFIGCGELDVLPKMRGLLVHRFGDSQVQEKSSVHARMDVSLANDFSIQLTQDKRATVHIHLASFSRGSSTFVVL